MASSESEWSVLDGRHGENPDIGFRHYDFDAMGFQKVGVNL